MDEILRAGREQGFMEADVSMDTKGWWNHGQTPVLLNVLMDAGSYSDMMGQTGIEDVTMEKA